LRFIFERSNILTDFNLIYEVQPGDLIIFNLSERLGIESNRLDASVWPLNFVILRFRISEGLFGSSCDKGYRGNSLGGIWT
jgi:hypothetical protein